jgi:hypothetical protein
VPSNYFDNLSERLISSIKKIDQDKANFLSAPFKLDTPYKLPADYFVELPATILSRIKSQDDSCDHEPNVLSPLLLELKTASTFKLPTEYFEELPLAIIRRIKLKEVSSGKDELEILSPLLGQLQKTVPFKLPEHYFDEFPSNITAGANAIDYVNQELESHSPVINNLKIKSAYKVPDGYFDNLENKLLSTVKFHRKASVISFNFNKKVLRYGVAALVAGIMSIAAWIFYQNKQVVNIGNELADIEKISNDEIISYLEATPEASVENAGTASVIIKEEDVKDLFADVLDEELQQYLEQNAVSKSSIIN